MTVVDFFFDLFSTSFDDFGFFEFFETGYWARSFGKHFGSSGGVREGIWGRPGGSGGRPWGVLGPSWGRLGALLGRLGGSRGSSWGVLGRSWGDLF